MAATASTAKGEIATLYLLHGEEDFLLDERLEELKNLAVPAAAQSFNVDIVYGSKADVSEIIAQASAFPMMSERRAVIVKEADKLTLSEEGKEVLSKYIKHPALTTVLIVVAEHPDLRKKPFSDLKNNAVVEEFKRLREPQLVDWIRRRVKKAKKTIADDAAILIAATVGDSLRMIDGELAKLLTFINDRETISSDDITAVVGLSKKYSVFELVNAVGRKDAPGALAIINRMLEVGEAPQQINAMLTRFFIQLWKYEELRFQGLPTQQLASELGVAPYFLKQTLEQASNFTAVQVEACLAALLAADVEMKTRSTDQRTVMEVLIYALTHTGAEMNLAFAAPLSSLGSS
jgi:DNA polymerase-3 subunit delta